MYFTQSAGNLLQELFHLTSRTFDKESLMNTHAKPVILHVMNYFAINNSREDTRLDEMRKALAQLGRRAVCLVTPSETNNTLLTLFSSLFQQSEACHTAKNIL